MDCQRLLREVLEEYIRSGEVSPHLLARAVRATRGKRRLSTREAAQVLGLSRYALDHMERRAPEGLPCPPINVGAGCYRIIRWPRDPGRLSQWANAYGDWKRREDQAEEEERRICRQRNYERWLRGLKEAGRAK